MDVAVMGGTRPGTGLRRVRPIVMAGVAGAAAVLAISVYLRLHLGSPSVRRGVDDIGQCVAASLAAAACAWRGAALRGRARRGWWLIAAGLTGWACGEVIWSYFEVWVGRETPFPSLADAGYLLFPAFALAGLLVLPSPAHVGTGGLRFVLDGGMVAAALFVVSWETSLGSVYRAGGTTTFAFLVGLAYPVSDLVLTTTAVMIVVHSQVRRSGLVLVAGMAAMAVADSGFVYLTSLGTYRTGSFVDIAWFTAFLLFAVSAMDYRAPSTERAERIESVALVSLPYLLVIAAATFFAVGFVHNGPDPVTLVVAAFALASLIVRQFLTLVDNRRLTLRLLSRQKELQHQAFHDVLTGLANRALFFDRLAHALEIRRRDHLSLSVMFCDLDDFKAVNDSLGHGAGDEVLQVVAARLRGATRASDTLARLGGDEFAMLVEDHHDAGSYVDRIVCAMADPVDICGLSVNVRASIGIATIEVVDETVTVEDVLRQADAAMYEAKRAVKRAVAVAGAPVELHPRQRPSADVSRAG